MNSQENPEALKKAYKHIAAIVTTQGRFIPFELIYGDGTTYKPLTKQTVKLMYDTIQEVIKEQPTNILNTLL